MRRRPSTHPGSLLSVMNNTPARGCLCPANPLHASGRAGGGPNRLSLPRHEAQGGWGPGPAQHVLFSGSRVPPIASLAKFEGWALYPPLKSRSLLPSPSGEGPVAAVRIPSAPQDPCRRSCMSSQGATSRREGGVLAQHNMCSSQVRASPHLRGLRNFRGG